MSHNNFYNHFAKEETTGLGRKFVSMFRKKAIGEIYKVKENTGSLKILDIGPGRGDWIEDLEKDHHLVFGYEYAKSLCLFLREKEKKVVNGNALILPFPDQSFDLIVCIHFIEHLSSYKEVITFLSECHRILKSNNGVICIVCPNFLRFKELFYDVDNSHHYPTTPGRLRQLMEDVNFRIKRQTLYHGPFSSKIFSVFFRIFGILWPKHYLSSKSWKSNYWKKLSKIYPSFEQTFLMIASK